MAQSGVFSLFLYGVVVTEESFRKGVRAYVKADISRKQICKGAENEVPGEILNQLLDNADADARRIVDEKWAACSTRDAIEQKFAFFDDETDTGQVSLLNLVSYAFLLLLIYETNQGAGQHGHQSISSDSQHPTEPRWHSWLGQCTKQH